MATDVAKKKAYDAARYAATREKKLAYQRAWTKLNRARVLAYREASKDKARAYRKANAEKRYAYTRRWQRDNAERYNNTRRRCAGLPDATRPCPLLCECCGKPPGKIAMHLDHDHETGAFRGWLCSKCNSAIGLLGDNLRGVKKAICYLEKNLAN